MVQFMFFNGQNFVQFFFLNLMLIQQNQPQSRLKRDRTYGYTNSPLLYLRQQATIINKVWLQFYFIMLPRMIFMYTTSPNKSTSNKHVLPQLQINKGYLISRSLSHNDPISVHRQPPIPFPLPRRIRLPPSPSWSILHLIKVVLIAAAMHTPKKKPRENICFWKGKYL